MRFTNKFDSSKNINFFNILKWKLLNRNKVKNQKSNLILENNIKLLTSSNNFICWLGHASFLIQLNNIRILLDPVIANIPFYKRKINFPYEIQSLGKIDYILISHTHYDHFDKTSLKKLINKHTKIIAPLNMGIYLKKLINKNNIIELDWEDSHIINKDISITLTPAKHWGRRALFDTNKALWGGFIIKSIQTIFFAGDTAYDCHFKTIKNKFNIDYALLPIGAYNPEFIMKTNHLNPDEAFQAFNDLEAKCMIPMHYGTFNLTNEPINEPLSWIKKIKVNNQNKNINILNIGEVLQIFKD